MKLRIDEVEAALLAWLQASPELNWINKTQIQSVGQRSVDFSSEQIILTPPGIVVAYSGGGYDGRGREITGTRYAVREFFSVMCVAENLRGAEAARRGGTQNEKGAYAMLEDLKTALAGKKLTTASGDFGYCWLLGAQFVGFNAQGHALYSLEIEVRGNWDNVQ